MSVTTPVAGQIRIALPIQGGAFSDHFGAATHFRLIDADRATHSIVSQADVQAPPHVPGAFPAWLAEQGVQTVIVGGIGKKAVDLFTAAGIPVFIAESGATPEELVAKQLAGSLVQPNAEQCCAGHGHGHDHGHEHGHSCH